PRADLRRLRPLRQAAARRRRRRRQEPPQLLVRGAEPAGEHHRSGRLRRGQEGRPAPAAAAAALRRHRRHHLREPQRPRDLLRAARPRRAAPVPLRALRAHAVPRRRDGVRPSPHRARVPPLQ
uniref:Uncharacterized protein n=1 Tax=Triticum urartu TaxID=4572 RepID=A0A8R7K4A9_TRIUA